MLIKIAYYIKEHDMKCALSKMRLDYLSGRINRKIFEGLIFQYILDNFERFRLFNGDEDKWLDFLIWVYPRLSRAIDYYRERGASFDTYISAVIQWSSREFYSMESDHRATEYACWQAKAQDMEICQPDPVYLDAPPDESAVNDRIPQLKKHLHQMKITPRQILLLSLKSYYFISNELLNLISETTGISKNEIQGFIDRLHSIRAKREAFIRGFQERTYCQYYRCLAFQKRLSTAYTGTAKHKKLTNYLERAQKRYSAMKDRLSKIRVDATNRQISQLLNIPKGTVDSALYSIKKKCGLEGYAAE